MLVLNSFILLPSSSCNASFKSSNISFETLGLSQEEIAFRANIDRTYISMLERDVKQPTITTIFGLAEAFEMQPYELVKEIQNKVGFK